MKATKLFTAVLFIFAIAFLSTLESCKKDSESDSGGETVSKSSLLSASGWVAKTAILKVPTGDLDVYALMDECDKDNQIVFKSNKSFVKDAGSNKCDANELQTEDSGTWVFSNNETEVVVTDKTEITTFKIITLTSSELVMEFTQYDSTFQTNVTGKFSYKH
jgi:hypothetical protein